MVQKLKKSILGILITGLCFTGIGIKQNSYAINDWVDHWAKDYIQEFIDKGYVTGYSDGSFKPNNSINRAEFVKIFNKVFGLTNKSGKIFNDTKTHWAKNEIDIAVTNGVCNGKSATEFKPNDLITREEACVMLANYKKLADENYDKMTIYKDSDQVSSWAKSSVEGLIEKIFILGYEDGTFRPKGKITRAEALVAINTVLNNRPLVIIPDPDPKPSTIDLEN